MNKGGRVTHTFITALFVLICAPMADSAGEIVTGGEIPLSLSDTTEADAEQFNVEYVQIRLEIEPNDHLIRGQMRIQARTVEHVQPTGQGHFQFVLPAQGLTLRHAEIILGANTLPVSLAIIDKIDSVELVNPTDSTSVEVISGQSFLLSVEFEIHAGLITFPLGINSGPWSSVRSRDIFKNRNWLPFPIGFSDQFSGEMRINVPEAWTTLTAGQAVPSPSGSDRRTIVSYLDSTSVFTDFAFAAYSTFESDFHAVAVQSDSSFVAGLNTVFMFLERFGGHTPELFTDADSTSSGSGNGVKTVPKSKYITLPSRNHVSALAPDVYIIPDPNRRDPANSFLPEQSYARIGITEWINFNIRFSAESDLWLYSALTSYLTAEYIRETQGNLVYTSYMWSQRDTYFGSENGSRTILDPKKYLPPSEDGYSNQEVAGNAEYNSRFVEARGVWVLRMLADRVGRDKFSAALNAFVRLSQIGPVGTEDFLAVLEDASSQSLGIFFEAWIYGPGHPRIEYSYTVQASQDFINVEISQAREQSSTVEYFEVDAQVQVSSLSGVDSVNVQLRGPDTHIAVPVSLRPQFVLFDPNARILYEPASPLSTELLISGLRRSTSEAGSMAMLRRLRNRRIESAHLLGLRSVLTKPVSNEIRARTVEILGFAAPSSAAMRDLVAAAESESPIIRAAALRGLSRFSGSPEARTLALSAANSSQNPLVLAAAVESLVRVDSTLSLPVLQSAMVTDSANDYVRREAIKTLMRSGIDFDEKWNLLRPLLSDDTNPETRRLALASSGPFMRQSEIRLELLARWPRTSELERRILLDHFEILISPDELTSDEARELELWLFAEPETDVRRRLEQYIPIR